MKQTKIEDVQLYHELIQKMRNFFLMKGFTEIPDGIRLAILAACENPHSIMTYNIILSVVVTTVTTLPNQKM
jgi:hypothetical protein